MSSPCKRIKLTPKKQRNASEVRHTQESKVTSTPQRRSQKEPSPDISRISSNPSSDGKMHLSDALNQYQYQNLAGSSNLESDSASISKSTTSTLFSVATSEKTGVVAVEDYEAYINEFQKVKYTGRIWNLYKPSHDDTLYARILKDPQDIQEVVTELLLLYSRKPEKAICALLKFCVDVCGFRNFEVGDHYNFQTNASKRVIKIMESDQVLIEQQTLFDTERYLFMETETSLGKLLKVSIYNFLQKLILCAHERGILYDDFFSKHFFVFVKCLSFSDISPIRHTGIIFGIKILTAVVMIYSEIMNEESSSESSDELQKQEINNYLEFFYLIFAKNCRIQDNKLVLMRVECIYELSIWIRYFPKIFITQLQTVNYLLKLITDPSKNVRFAALEVCEAFATTPSILSVLKKLVPDFAEHIGKRFYDIDIGVAVKAINIHRILLKYDRSLITTDRFKNILNLVFDKHFLVGEAASRFLVSYLETTENSEEILLLQLAKFSMKPGYAIKPLLVEGCLNYCSAIRNWKLYLHIFLRTDTELDVKYNLAELFADTVHQVLMGRSTILREKSRQVTITDLAEHYKVASYLAVFPTLLEMYREFPQILLEFLKIPTTIKDTVLDKVPVAKFKLICAAMEDLFHYHDNENLIRKLSGTFHYLCNTVTHANNVQCVVENISLKYTNDLAANLNEQGEGISNTILKVSVLFENFDLSKNLKWETLFDNWGKVDETSTANLMSSCKQYLIWSLKNLTANNYTKQSPKLLRNCKEFTSTCFNMLDNLKGQPLHFKTYDCLCDIYITYMGELLELTKTAKQMENLKMVIKDEQLQNVLVSFLEKYVISNATMPLSERRCYIVKYISLAHINILSFKCLGNIFRYYHTYNKEYGHMIESSLSDIVNSDEITFFMVILYSLTIVYEIIVNKYGVVVLTTPEAKSLKLLIKQFLNLKEFKSPRRQYVQLIFFAINYSLKDKSKYSFFYFVHYFVDLLTEDSDRTAVLNFLKEKIPKKAEKNDAVLFLANHLQKVKSGTSSEKPKVTNIPKGNKENVNPKKKLKGPRRGGRPVLGKKPTTRKTKSVVEKTNQRNVDNETDDSDDVTIVLDSKSDDLEETLTALRV